MLYNKINNVLSDKRFFTFEQVDGKKINIGKVYINKKHYPLEAAKKLFNLYYKKNLLKFNKNNINIEFTIKEINKDFSYKIYGPYKGKFNLNPHLSIKVSKLIKNKKIQQKGGSLCGSKRKPEKLEDCHNIIQETITNINPKLDKIKKYTPYYSMERGPWKIQYENRYQNSFTYSYDFSNEIIKFYNLKIINNIEEKSLINILLNYYNILYLLCSYITNYFKVDETKKFYENKSKELNILQDQIVKSLDIIINIYKTINNNNVIEKHNEKLEFYKEIYKDVEDFNDYKSKLVPTFYWTNNRKCRGNYNLNNCNYDAPPHSIIKTGLE
jgi:hypothetical protein